MFWKRRDCECGEELSKLKRNFAEMQTQMAQLITNMNSLRGLINRKVRGIENDEGFGEEKKVSLDLEQVKAAFGGELPFELTREEINKKRADLNS